jgi:hypothetical protein
MATQQPDPAISIQARDRLEDELHRVLPDAPTTVETDALALATDLDPATVRRGMYELSVRYSFIRDAGVDRWRLAPPEQ